MMEGRYFIEKLMNELRVTIQCKYTMRDVQKYSIFNLTIIGYVDFMPAPAPKEVSPPTHSPF
jgi:hypothetical protein